MVEELTGDQDTQGTQGKKAGRAEPEAGDVQRTGEDGQLGRITGRQSFLSSEAIEPHHPTLLCFQLPLGSRSFCWF